MLITHKLFLSYDALPFLEKSQKKAKAIAISRSGVRQAPPFVKGF